jgi:hypothetical protein
MLTISIFRRQKDPHPRRRQRRLQAILEIPQRIHPQEIQIQAPSRLSRFQKGRSGAADPACDTTTRDRKAAAGVGSRGSRAEREGRGGAVRAAGSIWGFGALCGSQLVSGCMSPLLFCALWGLVTLRWPSGGHCRGGRPFLSYYLHPKLTR